jgi:hypothetical protein
LTPIIYGDHHVTRQGLHAGCSRPFPLFRRERGPRGGLRRRGMLRPGRYSVAWSHGGDPSGSISLVAQADGVRLLYWATGSNGQRTSVNELVPFRYTATRFGGRRQWLTCLRCGRRCCRLFGGRYFRCRQCHGLKYASRNENPVQRAMNRADRIANRLHDMWKGATKAKWEFPPKPSRMRWKTYRRLKARYERLQGQWTLGIMSRFGIKL